MAALTTATKNAAQGRAAVKDALGLVVANAITDYGCAANGSDDDTPFIENAFFDIAAGTIGGVYFPKGTGSYRVTSTCALDAELINFLIEGEPGAVIEGNFSGFLFARQHAPDPGTPNEITTGIREVRNLMFENNHASGSGLMINAAVTAKVVNCYFTAGNIGLEVYGTQCITVDTCQMIGCTVGIMGGNAVTVLNCDITGCDEGIRHHNLGLKVLGGRFEVNEIAIRLGVDHTGTDFASIGFSIDGLSMESNTVAIAVEHASAGIIAGCPISVNTETCAIGIDMNTAEAVSVRGVSISNAHSFSTGAVRLNDAKCVSFEDLRITVAGGAKWHTADIDTKAGIEFGANVTDAPDLEVTRSELSSYESGYQKFPMGTRRRISDSLTGTWGAEVVLSGGSGSTHVEAVKGRADKWYVCGLT